ncbi:MAG: flagellar brake protein [Nitrospinota bacterium]|nr:flagellar brake protein [Nitrospinota bacterium]
MGITDFLKRNTGPDENTKAHLKEISIGNTEINIHIGKEKTLFSSTIVELDMVGDEIQSILIDTLIPESGNELLKKNPNILVAYFFRGASYKFECKFTGIRKGKYDSLKLSVPTKILKTGGQSYERSSFRAATTMFAPILFTINDIEEKASDISTGGLSFNTLQNLELLHATGEEFDIDLKIPSQNVEMTLAAKVCLFLPRVVTVKNQRKNRCALQFTKLRLPEEEAISQYIMERQREDLQKTRAE